MDLHISFFFDNEPHLQYKPPKHKIKEKFPALIQYKTRYKDPYVQPEELKCKNNKQINKLLNEKSLLYSALFIRHMLY